MSAADGSFRLFAAAVSRRRRDGEGEVPDDTREPGSERGGVAGLAPERCEPGLLHHVIDPAVAAEERPREPPDEGGVRQQNVDVDLRPDGHALHEKIGYGPISSFRQDLLAEGSRGRCRAAGSLTGHHLAGASRAHSPSFSPTDVQMKK